MDKITPYLVTVILAILGFIGVKFWESQLTTHELRPTTIRIENRLDRIQSRIDHLDDELQALDKRATVIEYQCRQLGNCNAD